MKMKTFTLAAAGAAFLGAGTANAAFVGLDAVLFDDGWDTSVSAFSPNIGLADTYRVYAQFDAPAEVNTVGVASDGTPMTVENILADNSTPGSGFYKSAFGEPIPLNSTQATYAADLVANNHDTVLTLGLTPGYVPVIDPNTGNPYIFGPTPGFGSLIDGSGNTITLTNRAVFSIADSPYGETDGSNRVLIAQFTVPDGEHVRGSINMQFASGSSEVIGATFNTVPAPGALALLGVAGLAARRRRRA